MCTYWRCLIILKYTVYIIIYTIIMEIVVSVILYQFVSAVPNQQIIYIFKMIFNIFQQFILWSFDADSSDRNIVEKIVTVIF